MTIDFNEFLCSYADLQILYVDFLNQFKLPYYTLVQCSCRVHWNLNFHGAFLLMNTIETSPWMKAVQDLFCWALAYLCFVLAHLLPKEVFLMNFNLETEHLTFLKLMIWLIAFPSIHQNSWSYLKILLLFFKVWYLLLLVSYSDPWCLWVWLAKFFILYFLN